jgi:ABC-type branched-subunit amino acid transport system substrate-binding protein
MLFKLNTPRSLRRRGMGCQVTLHIKVLLWSVGALILVGARPATSEPFRTGVIVPLTGPIAEYGTAISNGITLARETRPEAFSSCEFIIEDSAYKTTQAIGAFQKLQTIGKVNIVYAFGGPMGEALAPVAESRKTPLIIDHIDGSAVIGKKYSFRYANSKCELGRALVTSLRKRKAKKVGIVVTDNQYVEALLEGFRAEAAGNFEVISLARITPDEVDLRALAPKVRAADVDAIGLFLFPVQAASLARNLHKPGVILFGSDFLESPTTMVSADGALEGAFYPNNIIDLEFQSRYLSRFKNEAQIKFAAEGYDVAMLIAESLCMKPQSEWSSPDAVMHLLTSVPKRRGAQGETEFKKTADGDRFFSAPVITKVASRKGFRPE